MPVINTNTASQYAQDALKVNAKGLSNVMQQLATGSRINAARDDAAARGWRPEGPRPKRARAAEEGVGAGDRFIAELLKLSSKPVLIAVNKGDRLNRSRTMTSLLAAEELGLDAEIFPISAKTGEGVEPLVARLAELMPEGPFLFDVDDLSDQPLSIELAELIREQILRRTFQELPHAVEVVVEEIEEQREGLLRIRALAWVESESQKGILVGRGGKMVRSIGTAARAEIEKRVGSQVHLDLSVRVRRSWRTDEGLLDRLGID
jgi:GTP-binding protein Era